MPLGLVSGFRANGKIIVKASFSVFGNINLVDRLYPFQHMTMLCENISSLGVQSILVSIKLAHEMSKRECLVIIDESVKRSYPSPSLSSLNSLAPGRFQFNLWWVMLKLLLVNGGWSICNEIALRWMPLDLTDDKSILVQVMAWCRQATRHYPSQCWPRSISPNGVTRPQWVNNPPW